MPVSAVKSLLSSTSAFAGSQAAQHSVIVSALAAVGATAVSVVSVMAAKAALSPSFMVSLPMDPADPEIGNARAPRTLLAPVPKQGRLKLLDHPTRQTSSPAGPRSTPSLEPSCLVILFSNAQITKHCKRVTKHKYQPYGACGVVLMFSVLSSLV